MNYPMVKKNQRVWNGKWYSTVAYRGNLYYKLPWCTEAEPQIALSFSLCMSLYAQCILRRCARKSLVCVFWVCLVSFFWYQVNDSHVSQFCASMHAAQDIHTLIHTHTHTKRYMHTLLSPVPLHESSSNTNQGKNKACFCDWSDHPSFPLPHTYSAIHTTHTIIVISVFTSTSLSMKLKISSSFNENLQRSFQIAKFISMFSCS